MMPTTSLALAPLPGAAGPLTSFLFDALLEAPHPLEGAPEPAGDPLDGDDLHRALYVLYELRYGGWEGVDPEWESEPTLLGLRRALETRFEVALQAALADWSPPEGDVPAALNAIIAADPSPSLARHLAREGTEEQLREFLVHRSAYLLKEADPHVATIPRLRGKAKAALVEILADEYGGGRLEHMHSELYRRSMGALGLDGTSSAYVDLLPGPTLAAVNVLSLFGAHHRWRGALVGHLAVAEMTSSEPNRRYGNALRRLGFDGPEATEYFDEHVEADAVHEAIAAHDMAGGLAADEPELVGSILLGAQASVLLDGRFAERTIAAWGRGESSLRAPLPGA